MPGGVSTVTKIPGVAEVLSHLVEAGLYCVNKSLSHRLLLTFTGLPNTHLFLPVHSGTQAGRAASIWDIASLMAKDKEMAVSLNGSYLEMVPPFLLTFHWSKQDRRPSCKSTGRGFIIFLKKGQ